MTLTTLYLLTAYFPLTAANLPVEPEPMINLSQEGSRLMRADVMG